MKQLDRLLFEQGNDCFFCRKPLERSDASVEHLLAVANGGSNAEENVVACCKAVNALFGSKPLKEKLAIILRQGSGFCCPQTKLEREDSKEIAAPVRRVSTPLVKSPELAAVATTPTPVKPGPPAIRVQKSVAAQLPSARLLQSSVVTCPTCKSSVVSAPEQIDYVCPRCRGAFRY
jgi:hypothetical protein